MNRLTLAIFKPDLTCNPLKVKKVINLLQENNFQILRSKTLLWNVRQAKEFYEEHKHKFFFERVINFMTSGHITACILSKENAIKEWRQLLGPTHPHRARLNMPNSLRALYGLTDTRNSFHGSDSWINAKREISLFFPDFEYEKQLENTSFR
jgi:nucleoside-diphosphate kinase